MGLYGIINEDTELLNIMLIPFIIEIGLIAFITISIGITLLVFIMINDNGSLKMLISIFLSLFLILLVFDIFQIFVLHVFRKYIANIKENKKRRKLSNNNSCQENLIQNTNIYDNSSSNVPPLPPRDNVVYKQGMNQEPIRSNNINNQMAQYQYNGPQGGYPSMTVPNNVPPNTMPYNSLYPQDFIVNIPNQNQIYDTAPPPYVENENFSNYNPDAKH
ncbi:hypothetical protein H8356DRAFT_1713895 [Neocallimastix lanati (nom. inval.)]|uniref:Uncharacterized protein n=1 Tax=Neocallimastix californiae TaxID=1754190 RepID=A0A1Y2A5F3_9FUNG|nr:hypothetical protein H8356DRAFT_1713895 [Neocallimastix sp. JGI-2020a]ORY17736.1 hypothetical protein LY90DRAFT_708308 [Neocallimastix californiae]|eukprot:ORY17736.1 hypothetical protein LY90DRAFT_708308 [Neocallimastix californiae]